MSRTIRKKNLGRFKLCDIERERAKYRNQGFSEDYVERYTEWDIRWNSRIHRDGQLIDRPWSYQVKYRNSRQVRRDMSEYLHRGDWEGKVIPKERDYEWCYD